jgi:hypothetical protein
MSHWLPSIALIGADSRRIAGVTALQAVAA